MATHLEGPIDHSLSRRRFLRGSAALAGGLLLPGGLIAATQAAPLEVRFTATKDAITVPPGIVSGVTHVVVANQTGQDQLHLLTMLLPPGVTKADLAKMQQAPPNAPVPDWWLKATMVGNPDWPPKGGVSEGFVDYAAGTYAIANIFGSQWTMFAVTKAATTAPEPAAGVAVATKDMNFRGLDQGLPTGRTLLKVTNGDPVAHEMSFLQVPSAATPVDAIEEVLMKVQDPSQMPAGYKLVPGGTGILTPGVSMWLYVDFAPRRLRRRLLRAGRLERATARADGHDQGLQRQVGQGSGAGCTTRLAPPLPVTGRRRYNRPHGSSIVLRRTVDTRFPDETGQIGGP